MEVVGLFYGHLVYLTAIWYMLWPFGTLYGYLVYFTLFWYVAPNKSGNPVPPYTLTGFDLATPKLQSPRWQVVPIPLYLAANAFCLLK
jgi:hypothetical protein